MATNAVLADGVQPSVLTIVTLYTASTAAAGTRVIAFTATNSTATPAKYSLHIVPSGGTADDSNRLVSNKGIAQDVTDVPAAIQNHLIPPGGVLAVSVSVINTIAFRATGIEF
jgi:hypothetical protein